LFCLGLLAVTALAYWPVGRADFISMDDQQYVADNPVVQAGLTANGLRWAFFSDRVANYHPLAWLSHMLDCELFGNDPHWHHRVNLLFHAASAVLLFLVLRRMTKRAGCSAFVAAIFALHPQHVESVAWISERKDVLSAFFCMLTLGCYTLYVERPTWRRYALTLLMFALGLLSKPMLVTLPCVLLLLDFWPLRRTTLLADESAGQPLWKTLRSLVVEKIPFVMLSVGSCIGTMIAQSKAGAVLTTEQVSVSMRVGNALVSYAQYVRKFLWPTDLAGFYPLLRPWPITIVLGAVAVLLLITSVSFVLWRKKPYLAVGWLWFIGMLVPVIGLVQVGNQSMADRYVYLPMIGLTLMVAWGVSELLPRRSWQFATAAVAISACTFITADDVKYWNNTELLFTRALSRTEPSAFALHNLAAAQLYRGETALAIENFEECARLQPANAHVRRSLGYAYQRAERYPAAHEQLARALELDPKQAMNWSARGSLYAVQGDWAAAAEHFATAVQLKPHDFDSWINLAVASRQMNRFPEAQHALEQAVTVNPRVAQPWYMLGRLANESGRPAEAVEPLKRAIGIDPTLVDAYHQLGAALMASGRGGEAAEVLMYALRRAPNSPDVLAKLAWVLATHPDEKLRRGEDAIFLANRANQLTNSSKPEILDALAAAQAEQKQFDDAATTATQAATLARKSGDAKLAERIESRAAKYRAHSAVRDSSLAGTDVGEATP
jgi:tetratricopeptide (TPR) repeat protein